MSIFSELYAIARASVVCLQPQLLLNMRSVRADCLLALISDNFPCQLMLAKCNKHLV